MAWVSDPARTKDELFTVEAILECVRGYHWPFTHERKLNPAHRAAFHRDELEALANRAKTLTNLSGATVDDRPLLRFSR